MGIQPLQRSELSEHETLFSIVENVMGFLPNSMLIMGRRPDLLYSFSMLTGTVLKEKPRVSSLTLLRMGVKQVLRIARMQRQSESGVSNELKWLVAYVTSVSGGCRYCQGHTAYSASRSGVSIEKIRALAGFERSDLFTDRERLALRLAAQSNDPSSRSAKDLVNDLENCFDEQEVIEIVAIISLFRYLNTWNSLMDTAIEDVPQRFVTDRLDG